METKYPKVRIKNIGRFGFLKRNYEITASFGQWFARGYGKTMEEAIANLCDSVAKSFDDTPDELDLDYSVNKDGIHEEDLTIIPITTRENEDE